LIVIMQNLVQIYNNLYSMYKSLGTNYLKKVFIEFVLTPEKIIPHFNSFHSGLILRQTKHYVVPAHG
jgi:hypothetical protein